MYLFVARDMPSEWKALRRISEYGGLRFRLLVEAVCETITPDGRRRTVSPDAMLAKLAVRVAELAPGSDVSLDFDNLLRTLSPSDVAMLIPIVSRMAPVGGSVVRPVVRTSTPPALREAIYRLGNQLRQGLVVRVDGVTSFDAAARVVAEIQHESGFANSEIDLVVDAKDIPRHVSFARMLDALPLAHVSRSWTVLSGTFPNGVSDLSPKQLLHRLSRSEWHSYKEYASDLRDVRIPDYGDYGIQHAVYTPSSPFRPSASVRYTARNEFLVFRGYRDIPDAAKQYIGHARLLLQMSEFGERSDGFAEDYVRVIATDGVRTGNPGTWRVASVHRHTALMVAETAAFAASLRR